MGLELVKAESKAEELRAVLRERDEIGAERPPLGGRAAAAGPDRKRPVGADVDVSARFAAFPTGST